MPTFPPLSATAMEYRARWLAGHFTSIEGITRYLDHLQALDRRLGAVVELFGDEAVEAAGAVDRRRAAGDAPGVLEGIPFTVKANICTRLGTTTASSRILAGFRSPNDATAVRRLLASGAILVGKTNLDEFGMGSSCENSSSHPTRNPWDLTCVPGGSSGGAAALAGSMGWGFHLGSDTGGSIRQPAAFCGATGMKPTYGLVSRSGLLAFGSSLDQIGPLGRSAEDAAAVLGILAGHDPLDATSLSVHAPCGMEGTEIPRRVGIPREYFGPGVEAEVQRSVEAAMATLGKEGIDFQDVSLPHTEYANPCYQVISTAEASSNLARYDGIRYGAREVEGAAVRDLYLTSRGRGFGAEVRRRILLGTFVLSAGYADAYYQHALRVRRRIRQDFTEVFRSVDALVCPTCPTPPFKIGERVTDPLALYASDILTVSANLAGVPGISVPCGPDSRGLPVGLQILGPAGGDGSVLALAGLYQRRTEHHRHRPEGLLDDE